MVETDSKRITSRLRRALNTQLRSHVRAHFRHPLHRTLQHSDRAQSRLAEEHIGRYKVLGDLQVYILSAPEAARSGLRNARPDGRILLVQWPSGLLAQVDVRERDGKYDVARMNTGAMALELAKAIDRVQRRSLRGRTREIETRILSVPSIHLVAAWSHHPKGIGMDRFVPVTGNFIGLQRQREYSRTKIERGVIRGAIQVIIRWYERQQNVMMRLSDKSRSEQR